LDHFPVAICAPSIVAVSLPPCVPAAALDRAAAPLVVVRMAANLPPSSRLDR
jgi:hypothetical protein